MAYGIVGETGFYRTLAVPYSDSGYGELRTETTDVVDLWSHEVSIHTAISMVDTTSPDREENHSIGITKYVENGKLVDLGTTPSDWSILVYSPNLTFYQVAFHVSLHGGYVRGSCFCHYWGDPTDYGRRERRTRDVDAFVVYDTDHLVRHVHRTVSGGGEGTADRPDADPLELARSMGHEGDLSVARVDPADLPGTFHAFDPVTNRVQAASPTD